MSLAGTGSIFPTFLRVKAQLKDKTWLKKKHFFACSLFRTLPVGLNRRFVIASLLCSVRARKVFQVLGDWVIRNVFPKSSSGGLGEDSRAAVFGSRVGVLSRDCCGVGLEGSCNLLFLEKNNLCRAAVQFA